MHIDILHRPANTVAKVLLPAGGKITCEAGSMIAMNSHISIQTTGYKRGQGSLMASVKRLFAGESYFLNFYHAPTPGSVWLSTPLPGDMQVVELNNNTLIVQAGSFLAASDDIQIDVGWQGFKNLLSGESLFWLKLSGKGKVILSSYGAIYTVDLPTSGYVVDTGHIVAFEESASFTLAKAGTSWLHSYFGGEGIVCKFAGQGRVYCQSHNAQQFGGELTGFLKPKRKG